MTPARADRPARPLPLIPVLALAAGLAHAAPAAPAPGARTLFANAAAALAATRFEEAATLYDQAAAAAATVEGRVGALTGAGFALFKLRRYEEAADRLVRATATDPNQKKAWNTLGVLRLRQYETGLSGTAALDSALAALTRTAALDPAYQPENSAVAKAYAEQEALWAAAAATRAGQPPRTPAATGTYADFRRAANAAEREGDLAFARLNAARAEALAPTKKARAAAANTLGLLALRARDPQGAAEALRRATGLDPGSKFAWNNLGVALMRWWGANGGGRELVEQATEAFRRVRVLDAGYKPENAAWGEEALAELTAMSATTFSAALSTTVPR